MPSKINAKWHEAHKMPKNPSLEQRIEWHVEHAEACACRPMPASVKAALRRAGRNVRDIASQTMRSRAIVVLLALAAPIGVDAQVGTEGTGGGYFGAPVLTYTRLRGQGALMLGGRGGWIVTRSVTVGGGLYGTLTEVDARPGSVSNAPGPLDIKLDRFGVELEYALTPAASTGFTLGGLLGGAAARYTRDGTNEQHGETDFLLLVEPAVGLEQVISRRLRAHLGLSYRLVGNVEQEGLRRGDLQAPAASLSLEIGRFP